MLNLNGYDVIVVLGPTASGKTRFACQLAATHNGEIISADSRQVYKRLNIGTGKDLDSYLVNGKPIPYHLIDIVEPDAPFFLHHYQTLLFNSIASIRRNGKLPIVCGGTGLYLSALYKAYELTAVPENETLRRTLQTLSKEELLKRLHQFPAQHTQHIDTHSVKRIIRGIEVAAHLQRHPTPPKIWPTYNIKYIGIHVSKEVRIKRIRERLQERLKHGLIQEAEDLVASGISHQRLQFLGLEYKYLSHYLLGQCTQHECIKNLETAIIQYAKRQMTWFRKMEKEIALEWIDPVTHPSSSHPTT